MNEHNKEFELRGRVVDETTQQGLEGLRVIAVDEARGQANVMLVAETVGDGTFVLVIDRHTAAQLLRFPPGCDLWRTTKLLRLSVFNGRILLGTFEAQIGLEHLTRGELPELLRVRLDDTAREGRLRFEVSGRVVGDGGAPQVGITLRAYRVELLSTALLGLASTDASGAYTIAYDGHDGSKPDDPAVDLQVIATLAGEEVARSPVVFSPEPRHRIDLVVGGTYRGRAEIDRIQAALAPHLGETPAHELGAGAIEILARRADIYPPHLAMHIQAARLAEAHEVEASIFYALMRAGLPADLPGLLSASRSNRRGALEAAYAERILPEPTEGTVETAVEEALEAIDALVVDASLVEPQSGETNLRALLDTSDLNESLLRDFLELQVAFEGSNKELWEAVHAHANLTGAPAETLEFTMEAAMLVRSFLPALEGLQSLRVGDTIETVADLAAWDVSEWLTFIGNNGGAPNDLPGETPAEREQLYAETMTRIIEDRYPTKVLARRIERDEPPSTTGVVAFLDQNPDFDIARTVIPVYLDDNPGALPGDPEVTAANLKTVQRVWSLTPRFNRYDVMHALLDEGITSASAIVHAGPKAFAEKMASVLDGAHPVLDGAALVNTLYQTAVLKHTSALALLSSYSNAFNQITTGPVGPAALPSEGSGVPTLAGVMGSLDFCACEHCRSMLSPAAHLVELLSRLDQTDALDVLEERRGDLRHIELSCVNTNTPLPYIDVVNELLEYVVSSNNYTDPAQPPAHQTTWTAAELRRFPEHRDVGAYEDCAEAVYPWSLPMHLPSVELGLYLDRLGVGRHEMMRALQKPAGTDPAPEAIAAEAHGMTLFERDLVTGAVPADKAEPWHLSGANFADTLRGDVRRVLDTVGVELDDLLRLLALRFVVPLNGQPQKWLEYANDEPSCDLDDISLHAAFVDGVADRLHRFVRLSRKTGLTWPELDSAIRLRGETRSLDDGVIDDTFLAELADLSWLRARLGLELAGVVAISSRIETHDYDGSPSLYGSLFLSKADPNGRFELNGDVLDDGGQTLNEADHYDTIRAAIRVNDADLKRLIEHLWGETAPTLTVAVLSALYAHATLARALRVRVDELLRLLALVEADPFASPAETVRFVEAVDEIAASGMRVEALDYLFRHEFDPALGIHLTGETVDVIVQRVLQGVEALEQELAVQGALPDQLLAHLEAVFADQQAVIDWMRIMDQPATAILDASAGGDKDTLIAHVESIGLLPGFIDEGTESLEAQFGDVEARYGTAILAFVEFRRERGQNALVDEVLSDMLGVSPEAIGSMVRDADILFVAGATVQGILVDPESTPMARRDACLYVHKASLLIRGLEIPARDIPWYFRFENDTDTPQAVDVSAFPRVPESSGTTHFERWRRVALGQALQPSFSSAHNPLPEIGAPDLTPTQVVERFVENTRWENEDIEFLLGPDFLDLDSPLRDPRLVARMRNAMELVRRTGVRAHDMAEWARGLEPTAAMAAAARRALKARHAESAWPDVVIPLTDALRERQRDALVAFMVETKGWFEDDIALFNALLVDPQMNSCMLTSRIRLALSSVQLFIQRLLLGMEEAEIPQRLPEDWPWMRIYRVWEANRKVFFWPENWAEPELRDDKTPFFRELEEQLDQGPLDELQVERAFADYLYKLHEVGHLDIVALCHEIKSDKEGDVAHVIGRTRGVPRKHFYRARVNESHWTPWEALPFELETDQIVMVAHNRRLFAIWLDLREETQEREDDGSTDPPATYFRFQLSWSERRSGEDWAPPRTTNLSDIDTAGKEIARHEIYLRSGVEDEELWINVLWSKGNNAHIVLIGYRYDDCLDCMTEAASPFGTQDDKRVGLTFQRKVLAQQQQAKHVPSNFTLFDWNFWQDKYDLKLLLLAPGFHRVMLSHPPHGTYVGLENPSTFDNDEHCFYIVRKRIQPQAPWYDSSPPEPLDPLPVPMLEPPPAFDMIATTEPWAGVVPGLTTMVKHGSSAADNTTDILTNSVSLATSEVVLALDGGGVHLPAQIDVIEEGGVEGYLLHTFYHPYTCLMRSELNRRGVDGLLAPTHPDLQRQQIVEGHEHLGFVEGMIAEPYPLDDFDFGAAAAYGVYNWELFYHVPLYLAERLRQEQRFEEAMRWYHYIFDPLGRTAFESDEGSERYWNVKPLYREAKNEQPDVIKYVLGSGFSGWDPGDTVVRDFVTSVEAWLNDPFSPHAIARLRPGTYRWVVLQRYLENLIEWADSLFRRDTVETINEATQLYLVAAQILGPRPRLLPAVDAPVHTYEELDQPEVFGGFAELEGFVPTPEPKGGDIDDDMVLPMPAPPQPLWWYFCVPPNEKLLAYWDTVADRLFKIRNCQNIEGVRRALALFDPPIDPALLVKAKAAGLDLGAVIADLQAPLPHHRYRVLAARALELVGDVRALGSALQQALERRDAEHLQELRSVHEVALLEAVRRVRRAQVEEAEENRKALDGQMELAVDRERYYGTRERQSGREKKQLQKAQMATGFMIAAQVHKLIGGILMAAIPTIQGGTGFFLHYGGANIGGSLGLMGESFDLLAAGFREQAARMQIEAGYDRRWDDWKFQEGQAKLEQKHIEQQKVAADIRVDIAKKELENHERQIEQAKGVHEFLRTRFTNEQLYNWMVGQISRLYFQSYKLAYDMAKKAERAMRYELGDDDTYVEFGHWDSLRKGLLAGERLQLDLRRMEVAYLEKHRREYELTKRVSLRLLDPSALLELQQEGECTFAVPEVVFDLDHPGHYLRRIKAVSLTVPAVVGPHVTLGAKLTLLEDVVRLNTNTGTGYGAQEPLHEDERFRLGYGGVSSIATSTAQADSGLFNLDFNDERLLPFEGSGAISRWRLELPNEVRQFDYDTITDVELQIQYTARDGGQSFRNTVELQLKGAIDAVLLDEDNPGFMMMLSAKAAFPKAWKKFLFPADGEQDDPLELPIVLERFPYAMRRLGPRVKNVRFVFLQEDGPAAVTAGDAVLTPPGESGVALTLDSQSEAIEGSATIEAVVVGDEPWLLAPDGQGSPFSIAAPENVKDLLVLVDFRFSAPPSP